MTGYMRRWFTCTQMVIHLSTNSVAHSLGIKLTSCGSQVRRPDHYNPPLVYLPKMCAVVGKNLWAMVCSFKSNILSLLTNIIPLCMRYFQCCMLMFYRRTDKARFSTLYIDPHYQPTHHSTCK